MIKDLVVDVVNHRFVLTFAVLVLIGTTVSLGADGFSLVDGGVILVVAIVGFAIWRALVTSQTVGVDSVGQFESELGSGKMPTLVEFYSEYCAGCLAVKPFVDQLEQEAAGRLRVVRLNIDKEPGRSLLEKYRVLFTPTFIYFDREGTKVRDSVLVLDKARILYDLEQFESSN
jgi:thioredoxin 1